MASHSITLHLPEPLFRRYEQRARWARRSLETELLDAVASAASVEDELPLEAMGAVEALAELEDEELWRLARQTMPRDLSQELEALHSKQRNEGLNPAEDATRAQLLREYERMMLMRAQAAKLLHGRGHDVSSLLAGQ